MNERAYEDGQFEKVMDLNVNAIINAVRPTVAIMKDLPKSPIIFLSFLL